ncbi:MAG: type II toxin-antitoxin system VapC family toxin [Planctomycetes bacterium]|nr:type II toxin-antitoxin system VapC family toxin [Planctomycetota bacterium]
MDKAYLLDTSAIFAYTKGEPGSNDIEHILLLAQKEKCTVYISFISLTELYYITWQAKDESSAKELIMLVKSLPVQIVNSTEKIALSAGRIKANHRLSVADAVIAATAIDKNAVLVHKDPELKPIAQYVKTVELPFKE